jgi:hypothetical protein
MCAFAFPATIIVVDELFFKDRGNVVKDEMMNNTVAEIGGKNFTFNRLIYYKTDAWAGLIPAILYLIAKFDKVVFVAKFKFKGVVRIPLVFAG